MVSYDSALGESLCTKNKGKNKGEIGKEAKSYSLAS